MNNKAYFSNIRSEIISILKSAEEEVLIAMAWFTNRELLNEVIQCLQRGVKVSLILLDDIINHCDFGADLTFSLQRKTAIFIYIHHR
jgi:phosphatidylserine/phosphatidylglycerophosphate/cardiolipin synthase-like enzyme